MNSVIFGTSSQNPGVGRLLRRQLCMNTLVLMLPATRHWLLRRTATHFETRVYRRPGSPRGQDGGTIDGSFTVVSEEARATLATIPGAYVAMINTTPNASASRTRSLSGGTGSDCRTLRTRSMRFEPPSAIAATAGGA